jgi:hypothetical protein
VGFAAVSKAASRVSGSGNGPPVAVIGDNTAINIMSCRGVIAVIVTVSINVLKFKAV